MHKLLTLYQWEVGAANEVNMNVVEGGGAQLDGETDVDYFINFAKSYYCNSTRE